MRQITVSTDVFAKIWAQREAGEDSEDAILRRLLGVSAPLKSLPDLGERNRGGVVDRRFGVTFPEGFEIFRRYRGVERRAKAEAGYWKLVGSDERFLTLNELSRAIGAGTENAWVNWWFLDEKGDRRQLTNLRQPNAIVRRSSEIKTDLSSPEQSSELEDVMRDVTWVDDVKNIMLHLGKATLHTIYQEVRKLRRAAGRTLPPSFEAVVRRTLEENSSDSDSFKGRQDLFYMPEGKGAGVWALR
jgi:hypothetical protein